MATLGELASQRAGLSAGAIDHLGRLTASWSLMADLAFSDLILMTRTIGEESSPGLVVLGQVRPHNSSTMINDDLVGSTHRGDDWPLALSAFDSSQRVVGEATLGVVGPVPAWCVPVRYDDAVIAVIVRLQGPLRSPGSLYEQAYLSVFERMCTMVTDSTFPFREDDVAGPGMPRVGDGVILLDDRGRIEFATPNAVNALHRLGVYASNEGRTLTELGLRVRVVDRALNYAIPAMEEIDRGHEVAILFQSVPLLSRQRVSGAVVLMRDVSDLRHLNRMVMNKEAAVREVHHRVKNNLQTISSLLRLQARRSSYEETRVALLEAERRVRSIALVHEVLSLEPGEDVNFDEIVRSLVAMVEDTVIASHPVEIVVTGDLGVLGTDVATPLAVVIAELLTNAVEHAFVGFDLNHDGEVGVGVVSLKLSRDDSEAVAEIRDNGRGLGDSFSIDAPVSLGLSIVRDIVRAQLDGEIEMRSVDPEEGGGTYVRVAVPIREEAAEEE